MSPLQCVFVHFLDKVDQNLSVFDLTIDDSSDRLRFVSYELAELAKFIQKLAYFRDSLQNESHIILQERRRVALMLLVVPV